MGSDCKDLAASLMACIKESECMKKHGMSARDCTQQEGAIPECQVYRNSYFECKRGQLDMRTRIRGQKVH
ncbi:cytochrome c oxidase assembly protein PET191 [Pelagophyceae sp. CCMP2097]|nr:cytochrome c oxidase assembly protein PET191 [Pelagophyceae sp. CCMP2097]